MTDLRNTIAHILEHKQHLAEANEATIQQYVVLPILRALGWDDANLASMEVLPEYAVEDGRVDYALKVGQKLALFLECKKWNESLDRHENQIVTYAVKAGMPIVCLTNGKIWRFYFSWIEGTSVSDRIFCETDIEDREAAISNLEKYLLKSNVASGEAGLNAEIALEEKEKTDSSKPNPIDLKIVDADSEIDNELIKSETTVTGEWTIKRVKDSLLQEIKASHEANFSEERCNVFYRRVAETQNLIEAEGWKLNPPKLNKESCNFSLRGKGTTRIRRVIGILLHTYLSHRMLMGRNGERIPDLSIKSNPPRVFVPITEEEARQLESQHGCEFWCIDRYLVYYDIPENISELLPVLKFAYKKHTGN